MAGGPSFARRPPTDTVEPSATLMVDRPTSRVTLSPRDLGDGALVATPLELEPDRRRRPRPDRSAARPGAAASRLMTSAPRRLRPGRRCGHRVELGDEHRRRLGLGHDGHRRLAAGDGHVEDAALLLDVGAEPVGEQALRGVVHDHVGPLEALDPVHGREHHAVGVARAGRAPAAARSAKPATWGAGGRATTRARRSSVWAALLRPRWAESRVCIVWSRPISERMNSSSCGGRCRARPGGSAARRPWRSPSTLSASLPLSRAGQPLDAGDVASARPSTR